MSDTPNFAIWHPEYDGHAPPNWREGMGWDCNPFRKDGRVITDASPFWSPQNTYRVPPEALTAPNEDAKPDGWTISGALSIIRAMSPDELAKHGITLAPEKDWATELWADLYEVREMPEDAELVRSNQGFITDQAAIALIRERVVLKGEG